MIRHNTNLVGTLDDHLLDEDVRKQLLELSEELHDDKREALAVFNNKVEEKLPPLHADCTGLLFMEAKLQYAKQPSGIQGRPFLNTARPPYI